MRFMLFSSSCRSLYKNNNTTTRSISSSSITLKPPLHISLCNTNTYLYASPNSYTTTTLTTTKAAFFHFITSHRLSLNLFQQYPYCSLAMAEEDHRRSAFLKVYDTLKSDLLNDPAFEHNTVSRQWLQRMLDYNVPGGKLNRGLSVIDSYKLLKDGQQLTEEEIFLSSALGWCVEWLQAYFLVLDDIMDSSHTRRGRPCWFRLPQVGMVAANDGILLRNHIPRILKKHFRGKAYYVDMVDLFNEVEFQTACGQMIDLITTIEGEKDISKYSTSLHRRIVQYKTAYYSFYLPVACALLMSGENLESHVDVKNILVEMGVYFQVQDDYLDCFGDPETIGKIGTDIEDYKCSWLVVKALEICNEEQKKTLYENYGKEDPACVAKVKVIYDEVNLKGVYEEYESKSYEKLVNSIEAHPNKAIQALLKSFLAKIYKRQK